MTTKTIRLSDEVLKMLNLCKHYKEESMSKTIRRLYITYATDRDIEEEERDKIWHDTVHNCCGEFSLDNKYGSCSLHKCIKLDNIIRITGNVHCLITDHKIHIDETFNNVVFRLAVYYIKKNNIRYPLHL